MENLKATPYISPEVEIIMYECSDIITTSPVGGFVPDDNEDDSW